MSLESSSTIFIPTKLKVTQLSPPTPAPSPGPSPVSLPVPDLSYAPLTHQFSTLPPIQRKDFLLAILRVCSPDELHFVAATVDPLLKRDFLRDLPPELALHVLGFIDHPMSLSRASRVNTHWNKLTKDDQLWQRLCQLHGFDTLPYSPSNHWDDSDSEFPSTFNSGPHSKHSTGSITSPPTDPAFSYRAHFKSEYTTGKHLLIFS